MFETTLLFRRAKLKKWYSQTNLQNLQNFFILFLSIHTSQKIFLIALIEQVVLMPFMLCHIWKFYDDKSHDIMCNDLQQYDSKTHDITLIFGIHINQKNENKISNFPLYMSF